VLGAGPLQLALDPGDPPVEVVDQLQCRSRRARPRVRQLQGREQSAALGSEQIADRRLVAVRDQRRVHTVLQRCAVLDQMHPVARPLTLAPDPSGR
jgi:hypothetical protein